MRFNLEFIIGIAYIALMVGMAWGEVGNLSGPAEFYPLWLPLIMLVVCGAPFFFGYLAGKNSR